MSQSSVQTKIGTKVTRLLQDTFDVEISVAQIKIAVDGTLQLKGVLIKDHHNDTLISVSRLDTSIKRINSLVNNKLFLGDADLYDGVFHMKTYSGEDTNNLTVFSRKFVKEKKNQKKTISIRSSFHWPAWCQF